jgi:GAF domain-containing protein
LLTVSLVGYYLKLFGGTVGEIAHGIFAFAAVLIMALLSFSTNIRARLRVFVAKNFFAYQFNYREEWLKFTDAMSGNDNKSIDSSTLAERSCAAIARLMEAKQGIVWLRNHEGRYIKAGSVGASFSWPIVSFLIERDWVVGCSEYRTQPTMYGGHEFPEWLSQEEMILVAPMRLHDQVIAILALAEPRAPVALNWEVRDLVKTLGRQTASYLAQQEA